MLRARPGNHRLTDYMPDGQPDLTWYNRYRQYEMVVFGEEVGLEELLAPKGVQNAMGQTIIPAMSVDPKNEVRAATLWFLNALLSQTLVFRGSRYVDGRERDFRKLIFEMALHLCIVGHGAGYVSDGTIYLVSGTNIVPIQDAGNPIPTGWINFWLTHVRPPQDRQNARVTIPNDIKVKVWDEREGREVYQARNFWSGGIISTRPSLAVEYGEEQEDLPMEAYRVFGSDEGFYPEALRHAGEIAKLDATIREVAITYGIPVPIISNKVGLLSPTGGLVDLYGNTIRQTSTRGLQNTDPTAVPLEFAQAMAQIDGMMEERMEWNKRFHEVVKIPLDITQPQDTEMSGVSRALMARPTVDRIEGWQSEITETLNFWLTHITGTSTEIEIEWPRHPFDTLAERRTTAVEMFNAGLWTLNESREYMDMEPVEGGDELNANSQRDNSEGAGSRGDGDRDPNADG